VTTDSFRGLADEVAYNLPVCNCRRRDVRLVKPNADGVERVNVDPFRQARFVTQKPSQFGAQRVGERVGEVVSSTRWVRAKCAARCKPTIVLPVEQ
jgi:hypothetical protein